MTMIADHHRRRRRRRRTRGLSKLPRHTRIPSALAKLLTAVGRPRLPPFLALATLHPTRSRRRGADQTQVDKTGLQYARRFDWASSPAPHASPSPHPKFCLPRGRPLPPTPHSPSLPHDPKFLHGPSPPPPPAPPSERRGKVFQYSLQPATAARPP